MARSSGTVSNGTVSGIDAQRHSSAGRVAGNGGRRMVNGTIGLRVPHDVITAKCVPYLRGGKPEARTALHNLDEYDIVVTYGFEYRRGLSAAERGARAGAATR